MYFLIYIIFFEFSIINIVSSEKPLFLREVLNRTYSVSAYYWGKTSSEFPFHVLYPIIQISIIYFLVGLSLDPYDKFFVLSKYLKIHSFMFYSGNWDSHIFHRNILWIIFFNYSAYSGTGHGLDPYFSCSIYAIWRIFR